MTEACGLTTVGGRRSCTTTPRAVLGPAFWTVICQATPPLGLTVLVVILLVMPRSAAGGSWVTRTLASMAPQAALARVSVEVKVRVGSAVPAVNVYVLSRQLLVFRVATPRVVKEAVGPPVPDTVKGWPFASCVRVQPFQVFGLFPKVTTTVAPCTMPVSCWLRLTADPPLRSTAWSPSERLAMATE
jgi:hypothetical protein